MSLDTVLIAELHGKRLQAARDCEDYLTSVAFGTMRFQTIHEFWIPLLSDAKSLSNLGRSLFDHCESRGVRLSEYESVSVEFWPRYDKDEPDVQVKFNGRGLQPFTVVFEVKLHSGKSGGAGERDQLYRYARHLLSADAPVAKALVYLTPCSPFFDLHKSLDSFGTDAGLRAEASAIMFGLTWQDVHRLAIANTGKKEGLIENDLNVAETLLSELGRYLEMVGLVRFNGMRLSKFSGIASQRLFEIKPMEIGALALRRIKEPRDY